MGGHEYRWQATVCSSEITTSSGFAWLQIGIRRGQRGLKMQPSGGSIRLGIIPGMGVSLSFRVEILGRQLINPMV